MKTLILNLILFSSLSSLAHNDLLFEPDFSGMSEKEIRELSPDAVTFTEPIVHGADNFSVEKKDGKMHIGFDIIIENPNKLGVVLKPSSLFLKIADVDMGWVRISEKIKIKRKTKGEYPFSVVGNSTDFVKSAFSGLWSMIMGQGVDFNLKGTVKAGVFFFKKKWKIDFTYNMTNEEFNSLF